jgi:transcriptional regulator with XRE-family HTH domain
LPALAPLKTPMATMLASVNAREVVKCDYCALIQFVPTAGISAPCRRCHVPLDKPSTEIPAPASPAISWSTSASVGLLQCASPQEILSRAIRCRRLGLGMSQRQLALRMSVPRTYVSKIENQKTLPNVSSLEKIAVGLDTTINELLRASDRTRQEHVDELTRDPFVAEILPFMAKLNTFERAALLAEAGSLARHQNAWPSSSR